MEEITRSKKRIPQVEEYPALLMHICKSPFVSKIPRHLARFYYQDIEASNSTHAVFRCYRNFHRVSGQMSYDCLSNSSWVWEEPLCEVDYFMQRYRLTCIIVFVVMFLGIVILVPDFMRFHKSRRALKTKKRDVREYERYHHKSQHERTLGFHALELPRISWDLTQSDGGGSSVEGKTVLTHVPEREMEDIFTSPASRGNIRSVSQKQRESNRKPGTILAIFSQAFKPKDSM